MGNVSQSMENALSAEVVALREKAEETRRIHFNNATADPFDKAAYNQSLLHFMCAIAAAYPELPVSRIYDYWCDNNGSVAYNAEFVKREIQYEMDVSNFCHIWHDGNKTGCVSGFYGNCVMPLERDEV